jgi:hypothetical protein
MMKILQVSRGLDKYQILVKRILANTDKIGHAKLLFFIPNLDSEWPIKYFKYFEGRNL